MQFVFVFPRQEGEQEGKHQHPDSRAPAVDVHKLSWVAAITFGEQRARVGKEHGTQHQRGDEAHKQQPGFAHFQRGSFVDMAGEHAQMAAQHHAQHIQEAGGHDAVGVHKFIQHIQHRQTSGGAEQQHGSRHHRHAHHQGGSHAAGFQFVRISTENPISETTLNRIALKNNTEKTSNEVQIAFMVDATGSMGDELEFLKMDLKNVISKVEEGNKNLKISTATVFYRDEGDEYVVKHSDFTKDINKTIQFINSQKADGGGDFPEAVHSALNQLNKLQWDGEARTRIAFLVLDAPPHHEDKVIKSVQASVKTAAEKGIKLIPIVASGIDKPTEFLMRFMAIYTNGTYVFITDDSGIGNSHLEPSVGEYQVEKLSNLMIRSSTSTRNAAPPWSLTCSWYCVRTTMPNPSSTPDPSIPKPCPEKACRFASTQPSTTP